MLLPLFTFTAMLTSIPPMMADCREHLRSLAVFYHESMVANNGGDASPSSWKPKVLIRELAAQNFPVEIMPPSPLDRSDFYQVHDKQFVDDVLDVKAPNGFGTFSQEVARSLPWTSGSLYSASVYALKAGVAVSPTSGFHHARFDCANAFCTFNGLIVAAKKLLDNQLVKRVAIIDADNHGGDGTNSLIQRFHLDDSIYHYTFGYTFNSSSQAEKYLEQFSYIQADLEKFRPDLIIYQAGADPHVNDPLGGVLSTEQMMERDRRMFRVAKALGIPIVWNLAGGYQETNSGDISPVIELHLNTFRAAAEVFGIPPKQDQTIEQLISQLSSFDRLEDLRNALNKLIENGTARLETVKKETPVGLAVINNIRLMENASSVPNQPSYAFQLISYPAMRSAQQEVSVLLLKGTPAESIWLKTWTISPPLFDSTVANP